MWRKVPDPEQWAVVQVKVLAAIAEYLGERPWREVQELMGGLDGIRTLSEYLPEP